MLDIALLKKLFSYIRLHNRLWWFCLITLLVYSFLSTLPPKIFMLGINNYIQQKNLSGFLYLGKNLFILYFSCFLLQFSYGYSLQIIGQSFITQMRTILYKKLLRAKKSFFDTANSGKILTYLTNDIESVRGFISEGIVHVAGNILKILVVSYFMFQTNYKLAGFIFFICTPITVTCILFFRNALRIGYRLVRQANSEINKILLETLLGHKEILLNSSKSAFTKEFIPANTLYRKSFNKVITSYSLFFSTIELTSTLVLVICIYMLYKQFPWLITNPGETYAFFSYVNIIFYPIRDMAERFNSFQSALAATERIFFFLENTPEEDISLKKYNPTDFWDPSQGILFKNVSFAYNKNTPDSLENITLKIPPYSITGIIGKTGSGKSTLIRLLAKLYHLKDGCIQIHGRHVSLLHQDDIRNKIHLASQDGVLLKASIRENITLKQIIPKEKFDSVINFLGMQSWITRFSRKWDHIINEQDTQISLGEKQLILIARSLLQEKPIVILDEITSHMDPLYTQIVSRAITQFFGKKTVLLITHQMQLLSICNHIIVLDKGRIVEMGSPEELLNQKGMYYQYKCVQNPNFSLP